MRPAVRLSITLLVVGLVFGMGVHYDVTEDRHWPYPTEDELATEYGAHVGEATLLFGTVESVDESAQRAEIEVKHTNGAFTMIVHGFEGEVAPGGIIQVLGTLGPDRTITAERVVVVNRSGGTESLKLALSGVGALVVLVAFSGRWRIDRDELVFEAR